MLPTVNMPEVEVPPRRSPYAARSQPSKGHPVPRPIIQVAGIANAVGIFPGQAQGTAPGASWNHKFWFRKWFQGAARPVLFQSYLATDGQVKTEYSVVVGRGRRSSIQGLPARSPQVSIFERLRIEPKANRWVARRHHLREYPPTVIFAICNLEMPPSPLLLLGCPLRTQEMGVAFSLGHYFRYKTSLAHSNAVSLGLTTAKVRARTGTQRSILRPAAR